MNCSTPNITRELIPVSHGYDRFDPKWFNGFTKIKNFKIDPSFASSSLEEGYII